MLRLSVKSKFDTSTQDRLTKILGSDKIKNLAVSRVYWLSGDVRDYPLDKIFYDPISEEMTAEFPVFYPQSIYVEVRFQAGVTDNIARSATEALMLFDPSDKSSWQDYKLKVHSGWQLEISPLDNAKISHDQVKAAIYEVFANPLLNVIQVVQGEELLKMNAWKEFDKYWISPKSKNLELKTFDLNFDVLMKLNYDRGLALSTNEIQALITEYSKPEVQKSRSSKGWDKKITEVELECFAQTWSEHCKHKIFAADIDYTEELPEYSEQPRLGSKKINSLYKSFIQKVTKELDEKMLKEKSESYLVSVFKDNAGIVNFDKNVNLCIKVETHNSPSALDPFGGALTGILGVNRDILGCGLSAKPIANTDVFCLSTADLFPSADDPRRPEKLKDPGTLFRGVHAGVEEGGNQSGIPTLNGAFHFASEFAAKPLIFVGSVGVMPKKVQGRPSEEKKVNSGDLVVVAGGRLGKDGVHGATFSSLALADNMSSSVVQIGDSITQKRTLDFTLKARDLGLIQAITDNGAGGVSSSIGEMASLSGGAKIDLSQHPVKYHGLEYWEMLVSESQERMSYAVRPENKEAFLQLASQYGVEAFVLGEFNDSGYFEVNYKDQPLAYLQLDFLHDGLEKMKLKAHYTGPVNYKEFHRHTPRLPKPQKTAAGIEAVLKKILSSMNVASKESLIRYYDHEVQAATRLKPYSGKTQQGASDAGVIDLHTHGGEKNNAVAVSCGLCPQLSYHDTYLMAMRAVDEAMRNLVATGADPSQVALVDNFCWPDPLDGPRNPDASYKLAQLVRACAGLYESAKVYEAPLVSGKDSMKNDFIGLNKAGESIKISVPPTLLVTAMARIPNAEKIVPGYFKQSGDLIYFVGDLVEDLYGSAYTHEFEAEENLSIHYPQLEKNKKLYSDIFQFIQRHPISSCHDISDGGLLTAVSESCFGNDLGADLDLHHFNWNQLWSESGSQFVISLKPELKEEFEKQFNKRCHLLGQVIPQTTISWVFENRPHQVQLKDLKQKWSKGVLEIYEN